MRFIKKSGTSVERIKGISGDNTIEIWQYPKSVMIDVNGTVVHVNRTQLKAFLARRPK